MSAPLLHNSRHDIRNPACYKSDDRHFCSMRINCSMNSDREMEKRLQAVCDTQKRYEKSKI